MILCTLTELIFSVVREYFKIYCLIMFRFLYKNPAWTLTKFKLEIIKDNMVISNSFVFKMRFQSYYSAMNFNNYHVQWHVWMCSNQMNIC